MGTKMGWCLIGLLAIAGAHADERGSLIVMEARRGQVTYEIEGKRADLDGVIRGLRERAEQTDVDPYDDVAIVLASDELSIRHVRDVHAALEAYGFRDIRVLVFDREKERLVGLALEGGILFTQDRAELMRLIGEPSTAEQGQ
jgi:hypothetical protein